MAVTDGKNLCPHCGEEVQLVRMESAEPGKFPIYYRFTHNVMECGLKSLLAGVEEESEEQRLYEDTGEYDEEHEKEVRGLMEELAYYAESGPTFDPTGKYLCESCNMRLENGEDVGACTHVSGKISMDTGGCQLYKIGDSIGEEHSLPQKISQLEANYGERPEAKGFGCYPRCEYGAKAKAADGEGRKVWCAFWGVHVREKACCFMNDGADLRVAPGE